MNSILGEFWATPVNVITEAEIHQENESSEIDEKGKIDFIK